MTTEHPFADHPVAEHPVAEHPVAQHPSVESLPGERSSGIDPRGPRFAAALTFVLLAVALLTGSAWVLAVQVLVFAIGSLLGIARAPYGYLFRTLVRPRLAPPAELEDPAPPRFSQTVGLIVTGVGLLLAVLGVPGAVAVAAVLALIAAFLNAAFGYCIGCELYLLLARLRGPRPASS